VDVVTRPSTVWTPRRAVLLDRVSTSDERKDPTTGKTVRFAQDPENQLLPLREAARRLGWTVAAEIPLPGLSAWDEVDAAEVHRRILEPFRAGQADVLMVWGLDRVVRGGVEEAFRFLRTLERDLGVDLWSLQEPFLNTTADPQQRELMVALLAWTARWESQRKSERLKAKAASNRNRAEAGGGRASWGRGKMPTTADIVRMRELSAAGKSYRAIRAEVGFSLGTISHCLRVHQEPDEQRSDSEGARPPKPGGRI
jgi:DNA invertase Pin-like site-specific DNA recombinase